MPTFGAGSREGAVRRTLKVLRSFGCKPLAGMMFRAADFVQAPPVSGGRHPSCCPAVLSLQPQFRDVEELMAQRGIDVSYETIRCWAIKFGPLIAGRLKKRRGAPSPRWHLHRPGRLRENNRAESSHVPIRRRGRQQERFKSRPQPRDSSPPTRRPTTPSTSNGI